MDPRHLESPRIPRHMMAGFTPLRLTMAMTLACAGVACGDDGESGGRGGDATAADSSPSVPDASLPDEGADVAPDAGNGFDYPCRAGEVKSCQTVCGSAGQSLCLKNWMPCEPPAEVCGNCADDDCDGVVDEDCPLDESCAPVEAECPTAVIVISEGTTVDAGETIHLSGRSSVAAPGRTIARWAWSIVGPDGSSAAFTPNAASAEPNLTLDVAGTFFVSLDVWDDLGTRSCGTAQLAVTSAPFPPADPEVGCADGEREGFISLATYTRIAGCAGAWDHPGVTPDAVAPICGRKGGDDGALASGAGCASADLCAVGWHVCSTWREVAAASPSGCAGATPPDAPSKSLFFAIRQPSANGSVCGEWGDGDNDVFGCGNLGHGLAADKRCGPLDRVLASTQSNTCGFNEAEPNLGPWQCLGGADSHYHEGALVTKSGCPNSSCSYDGAPIANAQKGGVLCCRD